MKTTEICPEASVSTEYLDKVVIQFSVRCTDPAMDVTDKSMGPSTISSSIPSLLPHIGCVINPKYYS